MNSKDLLQHVLNTAHKSGYRFRCASGTYQQLHVAQLDETTGSFLLELISPLGTETFRSRLSLLVFDIGFSQSLFGTEWEVKHRELTASTQHLPFLYSLLKDKYPAETEVKAVFQIA